MRSSNLLDQIESIDGIQAVVRQVEHLDACGTENRSGFLAGPEKTGELLRSFGPISLLLPRGWRPQRRSEPALDHPRQHGGR